MEIHELVGDENIYIFGKKSEEVIKLYEDASYCSREIYESDATVEELVDFIISKEMIQIGDPVNLGRLYKEIVSKDWFMAVSYTHLDVYKRQVLYWAEEYHIDGFRFDLMGLLDVDLMNRIRRELDERYGEGAVSYTHLDVYKRQTLYHNCVGNQVVATDDCSHSHLKKTR